MPWMPDRMRCVATTLAGGVCHCPAVLNTDYCWIHDPSRERKRRKGRPLYQVAASDGRWVSKIEEYIRSRGYVHTTGKFAGRTNMYRLARETGIEYGMIHDVVTGNVHQRMGMLTLGKLCGFFGCGPSDLVEWESSTGPPVPSREGLEEEYVSPRSYRERTQEGS